MNLKILGGPKGPSPENWHPFQLLKVIKLSFIRSLHLLNRKNHGLRLAYTLVVLNKFVAWYAVLAFVYTIFTQYYGIMIMPSSISEWGIESNIIIKPTTCLANLRF